MPYNNTPIAPSTEVTGQVSLPLARVQKIIQADQERTHVSKNGSFAIALATEMFIQHLATTTHNVVKAERKPRRNIQYRDVSSAIAKTDNLEFLVDVVPKTIPYKEFKKKQEAAGKAKAADTTTNGQTTLAKTGGLNAPVTNGNGAKEDEPAENGYETEDEEEKTVDAAEPDAMEVDDEEPEKPEKSADHEEEDPAAMQIEMEMRGPRANGTSPAPAVHSSGFTAINGAR